MPKRKIHQAAERDLSSVRSLVTSVSDLAKHLGLTNTAIYHWFKVDRIPNKYFSAVAKFYDVDYGELLPLATSELRGSPRVVLKPRGVLPVLIEVRQGTKTLAQAVTETGQSEKSLKLVLVHWGDKIGLLHDTLEALDRGELSLDTAGARLGVAKATVHGLRRKYGYAPGKLEATRPPRTIGKRRNKLREAALTVIAGRGSAEAVAREVGVSARNLYRYVERLTPLSLTELSHFPLSFRIAYADEVGRGMPGYVRTWLKYAETNLLYIQKRTKYPKTPESWKGEALKRLLIGVLAGEDTLAGIAASRGAEPVILEGLFTSELRPLGMTFPEAKSLPVNHQMALAELLIWQMDRKRRLPETA